MSEQLATSMNRPSAQLAQLYRRWSESGCGLLITGNMMVDRRAVSEPRQVVIDRSADPDDFAELVGAAKHHGALVWAQLNHGGRQVPRYLSARPVGPSPVRVHRLGAFATPRALTGAEIDDIVDRFGDAAAVAQLAGFDGVQIHAAHGYLISQFLSPRTNLRSDSWGGELHGRTRLLTSVVREVRSRVGNRFGVGVKLNSSDFQRGGFDEHDAADVIGMLDEEQVDLIEISGGTFESTAMMGTAGAQQQASKKAYFHRFAAEARHRTAIPLMLTGGFRSGSEMSAAVSSGVVDLVGLARPLVTDPEFAAKVLDDRIDDVDLRAAGGRVGRLDGLAQVAWYTGQLRRLSRGRSSATRRVSGSLISYLASTGWHAMRLQVARRRRSA